MQQKFTFKGLIFTLAAAAAFSANAQTTLKVYVGGQARPDVMRGLFDMYNAANPGVKVELETGGATSELQQKYLNTVLSSADDSLDIFLIDIVRPAQYASAGWIEPLDKYLGADRAKVMDHFLPAYKRANVINDKIVALPAFADSMFLYYRKDLLEKHGVALPKTWDELAAAARKIQAAEKNPVLQGLSFQGKAIEGAVCTFLVPYWSQGAELTQNGKLSLDKDKAVNGLNMWLDMVKQGVAKKNIAEVATDDTRKEFQAGEAVFAVNWAYAWNHFQSASDTSVKGKVGVIPLPAMKDGTSSTCLGGWQWAVSAYSKKKDEAAKLVRWLAGPQASKELALRASNLPTSASLYKDKDVLAANPWFAEALPVIETARARPVTPRYSEVSEVIRTVTNATMAGVKPSAAAVDEIQSRLSRTLR